MDPLITLYYFGINGRGCYIRAILSYVKTKWVDKRLTNDEWDKLKDCGKFEFSQLPVIEIGDKTIYQGHSISIYLGRKFGLFYDELEKDTEIISFILSTEDIMSKIIAYEFYEHNEEKTRFLKENFLLNILPKYLNAYEKRLKNNGGKFFVGNRTTLCEIYFTVISYTFLMKEEVKCLEKFPGLFNLVESYYMNELKEYFENIHEKGSF